MKKVLITGVTGQDVAYLSEFLIKKGYEVHGIKHRSSRFNTQKIEVCIKAHTKKTPIGWHNFNGSLY